MVEREPGGLREDAAARENEHRRGRVSNKNTKTVNEEQERVKFSEDFSKID